MGRALTAGWPIWNRGSHSKDLARQVMARLQPHVYCTPAERMASEGLADLKMRPLQETSQG
jgi:hypothetical protein